MIINHTYFSFHGPQLTNCQLTSCVCPIWFQHVQTGATVHPLHTSFQRLNIKQKKYSATLPWYWLSWGGNRMWMDLTLYVLKGFLTHWGQVMRICVSKISHHWFRQGLGACLAPSYYLNQCWLIVSWSLGNDIQWNFNQKFNIFIPENVFENVICKMMAILSRPQCVDDINYSFVFYTILLHWNGTGGWNPFLMKMQTYPALAVNVMSAEQKPYFNFVWKK